MVCERIHPLDKVEGKQAQYRGHGRHGSIELRAHSDGLCVCGGGGGIWIKQQAKKKKAYVKGKAKPVYI